jgi:hypothetical protein
MEKLAAFTVLFGLLAVVLAFRVARISSPTPRGNNLVKAPKSLNAKYGEQLPQRRQEEIPKLGGLDGELVGVGTDSGKNQKANFA